MPPTRRVGSISSETRSQILDATQKILVERGYASVTSRSVAAALGVKAGLVHYYFPTLDDLFIEVLRRSADRNLERMAAALVSRTPLRSLWELSLESSGAALSAELVAAANHRPALYAETSQITGRVRRMLTRALAELLPQYEMDMSVYPPALVAMIIQSTAAQIARERELGVSTEYETSAHAIASLIDDLEVRRGHKLRQENVPGKSSKKK